MPGILKRCTDHLKKLITPKKKKPKPPSPPEIKRRPGLKCPHCRFHIDISIPMLLSGEPIVCPGCGLKLSVDREKSKDCLHELSKVQRAMENVETVQKNYH